MDLTKFNPEMAEALAVSTATTKSVLTNGEDDSVVIPTAIRSKYFNSPAKKCPDKKSVMYSYFCCVDDISMPCTCRFENYESS
ncbi:hypothetical protein TNCV_4803491 [Trichonephila clavipes]|nr:hypothetical protein TNCV_4803491 [Trichonephila clavipes]